MCSPNIWGNQRWAALSLGDNRGGWQDWGVVCWGWSYWSWELVLVTWGAALCFNLLLSPWSPLNLSRRGEAGEHGPVYSAVTAHVTGHCMCHLSYRHKCSDQHCWGQLLQIERFLTKLTFADLQIINFSLMAKLCKHNNLTFLYPDRFPTPHLHEVQLFF